MDELGQSKAAVLEVDIAAVRGVVVGVGVAAAAAVVVAAVEVEMSAVPK